MNNDKDPLWVALQAKMQPLIDELSSQSGISESMLSTNSVSTEIRSADAKLDMLDPPTATDMFESHRSEYLAGRQYEADMHRERRLHYAKVEDELLRLKKEYDGLIAERHALCELLEECAREFCYLLDCEIESTSARQNATNLLTKIRQYIEAKWKDYEEGNS